MRPSLPERFVLLQQEGYLLQACLTLGLAQLSKSASAEKGRFYGAFFNLSIGTERLLKTILLIEHFIEHRFTFPSESEFKAYSHNLNALYLRIISLAVARNFNVDFAASSDPINKQILEFFSDFAIRSRYSNLDNLAKGVRNRDPLSNWNNILKLVFEKDVSASKKQKVLNVAKIYAPMFESAGSMIAAGMDGETLDFHSDFISGGIIQEATPYAVLRVVELLKPLKAVMDEIVPVAHEKEHPTHVFYPTIPYMNEFLVFLNRDRTTILKTKSWA